MDECRVSRVKNVGLRLNRLTLGMDLDIHVWLVLNLCFVLGNSKKASLNW